MRRIIGVGLLAAALLAVPTTAWAKRGLNFTTTVDLGWVTGTGHISNLRIVTVFDPTYPRDVYCFTWTLQIDPIPYGDTGLLTQEPPTFTTPEGQLLCYTAEELKASVTLDCAVGQIRFDGTGSGTYVLGFRDASGELNFWGVSWDIPTLTAEPGSKEAEMICNLAAAVAAGMVTDAQYVKQLNTLLTRLSPV